jgi:hypothetical protein
MFVTLALTAIVFFTAIIVSGLYNNIEKLGEKERVGAFEMF